MQLKKRASIRLALAAASSALLMEQPVQAVESGTWDVSFGTLFYDEKDRVSIVEPILLTTYKFNDEDYIDFRFVNDTMSGASPIGASVSSHEQTIPATSTSASGSATEGTKVAPGELPVNKFSDQRNAVAANWQKAYTRTFRSVIGVNFSKEEDYTSLGSSISLQRDTQDKLTTFTLGLSHTADTIEPYGGAPDPLSVLVNLGNTDPEDHSQHTGAQHAALTAEHGEKQKQTNEVLFGITQVVSRRILAQANYSIGYSNGYLTDPYKIISTVNPSTGLTLADSYYYEKRPDSRLRHAIFLKSVLRLPTDVMHISYRYFQDDWSIQSHTIEIKYRYNLDSSFYLVPAFRYYTQSGAEFFRYSLKNGETLPKYVSADLRLAPMQSTTTGLKLGYSVNNKANVSVRIEYLQQWGEDNPDEAVGTQTQLELFPKLEVMMYTFEISYVFD